MTACPKRKLVRDPKYLKWIREQPCVITGWASAEAAHIRLGAHAGKSEKPGDDSAVPLYPAAHRRQHNDGEHTFWINALDSQPGLLGRVLQAWRRYEYAQYQEREGK